MREQAQNERSLLTKNRARYSKQLMVEKINNNQNEKQQNTTTDQTNDWESVGSKIKERETKIMFAEHSQKLLPMNLPLFESEI
jgi:hypothetical protein